MRNSEEFTNVIKCTALKKVAICVNTQSGVVPFDIHNAGIGIMNGFSSIFFNYHNGRSWIFINNFIR